MDGNEITSPAFWLSLVSIVIHAIAIVRHFTVSSTCCRHTYEFSLRNSPRVAEPLLKVRASHPPPSTFPEYDSGVDSPVMTGRI